MAQLAENVIVADKFRLNRLLGRGGMGSVWHATHLGLDTPCAVKFIEGEAATSPEAHQRFEREAKAAAQLRSPNVVQIFDHGLWEGRPYIAMELLDGEDLKRRFMRVGKMHPTELGAIITQVCRALTKAHALGIVHRDLKPDNIFLVRDDDREIAKVLDFGIAKRNDDLASGGGSNTRTGAMLGTPYYMSPEQAQGIKSVDHRSDLWSLAVIAFQALTGQLPFQSEALGDLLVKIIVHPIPVPSSVSEVPPEFDKWWAKATQRDPAQRFQSAKDFEQSLNLAIGASQLTDVMDGRALRAHLAGMHPGNTAMAQQSAPFGATPQPNRAPGSHPGGAGPQMQPQFSSTPQSAMAHSLAADTGSGQHHYPPGHGGTLPFQQGVHGQSSGTNVAMANSSGGFPAGGSTGAPFTTTSGTSHRAGISAGFIAACVGAAIFAVLLVVAIWHFSSAQPVAATPTASVTAVKSADVPPPTQTATATAPATVATNVTPPATSASSATSAVAATSTPTTSTHSSGSSGSTHSTHGSTHAATSATAGSTSSKGEHNVDTMGF